MIALHTRIAIRAASLHKDFGDDMAKCGLPSSVKDMYLLTTPGKVIFNEIFPSDFPFINGDKPTTDVRTIESWFVPKGTDLKSEIASRPVHTPIKKKELGTIIDMVFHRYDMSDPTSTAWRPSKTSAILDKIKDQGFKYSTVSSVTVAISDINTFEEKEEDIEAGQKRVDKINALAQEGFYTEAERHKAVADTWSKVTDEVKEKVRAFLARDKRNPLVIMSDSGARGSLDNFKQLIGMKGCVANPKNEVIELPITSSYREGMTVAEFFINTHGARKGGADTALKTADSGYLTRRLVDVAQDVVVREEDCHCDHGFKVREIRDTSRNEVIVSLGDRQGQHDDLRRASQGHRQGRDQGSGNPLPLHLRHEGRGLPALLRTQHGDRTPRRNGRSGRHHGRPVDRRAGHPAHDAGLPHRRHGRDRHYARSPACPGTRRSPQPERRSPHLPLRCHHYRHRDPGQRTLQGEDHLDERQDGRERHPGNGGASHRIRRPPPRQEGRHRRSRRQDHRRRHQPEGPPREGRRRESRGLPHQGNPEGLRCPGHRHLRQAFGGHHPPDAPQDDDHRCQKALEAGKRPALGQPLVLGITKAALETESFLSAASFQETTRVLTDAAIKAKTDPLHGLKENVITGKLIPAGTGLLTDEEEERGLSTFTVDGDMDRVKAQYIEAHERIGD